MKPKATIRKLDKPKPFTCWFEDIYEENFERLYRYAYSITKSEQLAKDVVSEVFLNIWNNKPDYEKIRELKSYLHVSVKHLAIRMISKDPQRFSYSTYDESMEISDAVDPEHILIGKELDEIIAEAISDLSPHTHLVFTLSRNKGYSNERISKELGVSIRTVENHLYNALRRLKDRLSERFNDSEFDYQLFSRISSVSILIACLTPF